MDGFGRSRLSSRDIGVLFAEDFDLPRAAPKAVPVTEPTFSAEDLAVAREAGRREGHQEGLREAAASDIAATRHAVEHIAAQLMTECELAAVRAEEQAQAIARLLLDSLAATFPALCARHGDAEVAAVVRAVLPGLTQEPAITVRVHPASIEPVKREIARLDPELAARVRIVACDAMDPGDVGIAWRNGTAVRDAADLWEQVAAVLLPAGLLSADVAIKETLDAR
jgi:flagellar biosynthesis/type III secretory pathway protein FliH